MVQLVADAAPRLAKATGRRLTATLAAGPGPEGSAIGHHRHSCFRMLYPPSTKRGIVHIQPPSLEESLRTEIESWLCCALADVLALPTETTLFVGDRAIVADSIAHTCQTIEAVRLYVSECRDVAKTHCLAPATLAFAALAEAMCRLLEEEVNIVQDRFSTVVH